MTATQAPTPGPLTALEAIAKDAAERVQKNGGCVPQLSFAPILFALQDAASSQTNELKPNDIAAILEENADADADGLHNTSQLAETIYRRFEAFRLAPTAPVEASGSEREHGPKCWGKTSISDEMMYCYCGSTDSPPGETREALDRLKMAAHVYEDDEMAADCATLEALLSARPLALGGQS